MATEYRFLSIPIDTSQTAIDNSQTERVGGVEGPSAQSRCCRQGNGARQLGRRCHDRGWELRLASLPSHHWPSSSPVSPGQLAAEEEPDAGSMVRDRSRGSDSVGVHA